MDNKNQLQQDYLENEFDLRSLYRLMISNILLIIISTVVITIIGTIYVTRFVTPQYTASASVIVQVGDQGGDVLTGQRLIDTYTTVIRSNSVLSRVTAKHDVSIGALRSMLTISRDRDSLVLDIKITHPNPEQAAILSTSVANEAIDFINELDEENQFRYFMLEGNLVMLDIATIPGSPSSPNVRLTIIISFILGGMLGVLIVFIKEAFSNTFKNTQEIERVLGLPVISVIPEYDMDEE